MSTTFSSRPERMLEKKRSYTALHYIYDLIVKTRYNTVLPSQNNMFEWLKLDWAFLMAFPFLLDKDLCILSHSPKLNSTELSLSWLQKVNFMTTFPEAIFLTMFFLQNFIIAAKRILKVLVMVTTATAPVFHIYVLMPLILGWCAEVNNNTTDYSML